METLNVKVSRKNPELIAPARPTPHEFKLLSDIDDQEGLRVQIPVIQFYQSQRSPYGEGKDPVEVIRDAIAKALVFYYPFAGRLRERADRKLVVECTGEGILFIEADADVTLKQFGDPLLPPFPCLEELLYDVPNSAGLLHCPLLLIQVTRLRCGGFIFALRLNHTMSDAVGLVQFMSAAGELARGADIPSIPPIWKRHLLNARNPPCVTCTHHEYDEVQDTKGTLIPLDDMVRRSFFFGIAELAAIRSRLPLYLQHYSTFELLTACLWRCNTIAMSPDPSEEIRILFVVNSRRRFNPPIPDGYYGNALAFALAISTAGDLSRNPLHYAAELVKKAKSNVTEEHMKSIADLMVIKGRPNLTVVRTYIVSDMRHAGFEEVDFGWGKPAYGGPAMGDVSAIPGVVSYCIPFKNNKGENGIVVPVSLPGNSMDVFVKELEGMLKDSATGVFITSAL
uniref:Acyltransferase ACT8 n=1 Tax=Plectranthus barbatus TaxID=41228 RepID=A0A1B0VRQ8_9LAMI|nr:acyltransferase ACT8 [Plectranthus barbatus]